MAKILIACEFSGTVRDAFAKIGHYAVSCDIHPTDKRGYHYQGNVLDIINDGWDLLIAHPPCTFLSNAGACRMYPTKGNIDNNRLQKALQAKDFFLSLLNANIKNICVENPVPLKIVALPNPTQIIQPFQFGHPHTKKTLLWLKGLPTLKPTNLITENITPFCPSGTSRKLAGTTYGAAVRGNDAKNRSVTFQGIADAMAIQWGPLL